MLKQLHGKDWQKRKKTIVIVLGCLILPGFLFFGISASMKSLGGGKETPYGTLFNKPVSEEDYVQAARAIDMYLRLQLGDAYFELQKFFQRDQMVMQRLVMLSEAKKRRIRVSDAEIVAYIQGDPAFSRRGAFDKGLYEQFIQYSLGLHPRAYEEITRQNLAIRKLVEDVTGDVGVSDDEARESFRKENQQFSVSYIGAIPETFAAGVQTTDEAIKAYFENNPKQFEKPLSFDLEYIVLDSKDRVKDLEARIGKKESLEKIAKDNDLKVQATGLFNAGENTPIPGIGFSKEVSLSLQSLAAGSMLPLTEIEKKFYLFGVKERKEPYIPEFSAVKDEVKAALVREKGRELAREKIDAAAARLKEPGADFAKVAQESGLKLADTPLFSFNSYIEGVGSSNNFFSEASKLKDGEFGAVIDMPSGFYIVKVKERPVFDETRFSAAKEDLKKKLLAEKKQQYFDGFLKKLLEKALPKQEKPSQP